MWVITAGTTVVAGPFDNFWDALHEWYDRHHDCGCGMPSCWMTPCRIERTTDL